MYRYTHVHISRLDMESSVRIIPKKALLELHSRVLGKREQKRLHVCMGFEMVPTDWIRCHQRWIGKIKINYVSKIKKCLMNGSVLATTE